MSAVNNGSEEFATNEGRSLPRRLWRAVRDHGFRVALRRIVRAYQTRILEWRLGINTRGSIHGRLLGNDEQSYGYQPAAYSSLFAAFSYLHDLSPDDVFVDFGCGMGRAMIAAALNPFRRVIGVEISPELCDMANRYIANARRHWKCQDLEVVQADARAFDPPADGTVFFFFNPFDVTILRTVLDRLRQSWLLHRRRMYFVYSRPRNRVNGFAECDWLIALNENLPERSEWEDLSIYRTATVNEPQNLGSR